MMVIGLVEERQQLLDRVVAVAEAHAGVPGADDDFGDAGNADGEAAHRAWLDGGVEHTGGERALA